MADTFTEVSKTGYFKRILSSIIGMLLGVLLFFGSFILLYVNEGRVNLADVAKTAVVIDSSQAADTTLAESLVSATGEVTSEDVINDGLFFNFDRYLALERVVEVYAWSEEKTANSQSEMGGSQTTETTYTYKKVWTKDPEDSTRFYSPEGHQNSEPSLQTELFTPVTAKLGIYTFKPGSVTLPELSPINLQTGTVTLVGSSTTADFNYIYSPYGTTGSINAPEIGDMRISYKGLRPDFEATLFAKLEGLSLENYQTEEATLYRLFMSTHDEAIQTLDTEYTIMTWLLRALGFLMMWIGLSLVFRPLAILADVIPLLGKLTGFVTGGVAFLIALVLSIVTILVSMILQNFWLTLVALVIVPIGMWYAISRRNAKADPVATPLVVPVESDVTAPEATPAVRPLAPELVTYIQSELAQGKTKGDIQHALEQAGWDRAQVVEALNLVS